MTNNPLEKATTVDELIAVLRQLVARSVPVTPTTPLISSGIIDSFRFTELLALLEETYRVSLDAAALGADNFDTPAQMHAILTAQANGQRT